MSERKQDIPRACGDCGDPAVIAGDGRTVHDDGSPLCGGRGWAIRRHPRLLRKFYPGAVHGGREAPEWALTAAGIFEPPVTVVFRRWRAKKDGRGIIALFTGETGPRNGMCSSYEHAGQHGAADYSGVIGRTVPAEPEEFLDLQRELEGYPYFYNLKIRKRRPH